MPTVSGNVGAVFNGGIVTQSVVAHGFTVGQDATLVAQGVGGQTADFFVVEDTNNIFYFEIQPSGYVLVGPNGEMQVNTNAVGFFNTTPVAKPTVTGSKGANAALASLMTALAALGLVTNSTT